MFQSLLPVVLVAVVFNVCSRKPEEKGNSGNPKEPAIADLRRETVQDGIQVTFYPTYGYRSGDSWTIPTRTWVHENRGVLARLVNNVAERKIKCTGAEVAILKLHLGDFPDDDKNHEQVIIQFDSDPDAQQYPIGESDPNGLILTELKISDARARTLLAAQNSTGGWLTYHAVSKGHTGKGRIRLIEPEGVSIVSDIDDTIKVTDIPAGKEVVLRNTFCHEFRAAPGMADWYKGMGDASFHYISGGPWQLYGPLYDFLISGPGGFPEGTFTLSYFPKNLRAKDTRAMVSKAVTSALEKASGSLEKTYQLKLNAIAELMERFPGRKFILIGDSGEIDPEVYRELREKHPQQVQEIWIRDVVNDDVVNHDRLEGMKIIKAEPIVCASLSHYQKLSAMIESLRRPAYARNKLAPCLQ